MEKSSSTCLVYFYFILFIYFFIIIIFFWNGVLQSSPLKKIRPRIYTTDLDFQISVDT
jgi:hypothetical protein